MKNTMRVWGSVLDYFLAGLIVCIGNCVASVSAHAQTFSGTDPSGFGTAAVTDIQNAYSYVIPILGTACVAAGIFIIYKWIRHGMKSS